MRIPRTLKQILIIGVSIFTLRVLFISIYSMLRSQYGFSMVGQIQKICYDPIAIFALFIFAIIFTIITSQSHQESNFSIKHLLRISLYILLSTSATTMLYNRELIVEVDEIAQILDLNNAFIPSLVAVLFINIIIMLSIEVILHIRATRRTIESVTDQNDKTQYQYRRLKEQLNPHFLFNSLNILEYLVSSGEQSRASAFIEKLSNIYRYLLTHEEHRTVPLRNEVEFIEQYIDLLHERFGSALCVTISIEEQLLDRKIVPYGLLLTIENSVKHNIVNLSHPLTVTIESSGEIIEVRNNLQPRITSEKESLGIGLKNLDMQYQNIAERSIEYFATDREFVVKLPLIN